METPVIVALLSLVGVVLPAVIGTIATVHMKRTDRVADVQKSQAEMRLEWLKTLSDRVDNQEKSLSSAHEELSKLRLEILTAQSLVRDAEPVVLWVYRGARPPAPLIPESWGERLREKD